MKKIVGKRNWRLKYVFYIFKNIIARKPMDISISTYFLIPAKIRKKIFKERFILRNILKGCGVKIIREDKDRYLISISGFLILTPKEIVASDFLEIVFPFAYIKGKDREEINKIKAYTEANFKFSIDNVALGSLSTNVPYWNDFCIPKKGDIVFDIGANIGLFSLVASEMAGEKGEIYAIEPIKEILSIARQNISSNKKNNVRFYALALGEKNDDIDMYVALNVLPDASSKHPIGMADWEKRKVPQKTLDSFVADENIKKVDFIKIDIEGGERDFLRGGENTIKKFKPKIAICVYHLKGDPEVIEQILRSYVPEYKIEIRENRKLYAWI